MLVGLLYMQGKKRSPKQEQDFQCSYLSEQELRKLLFPKSLEAMGLPSNKSAVVTATALLWQYWLPQSTKDLWENAMSVQARIGCVALLKHLGGDLKAIWQKAELGQTAVLSPRATLHLAKQSFGKLARELLFAFFDPEELTIPDGATFPNDHPFLGDFDPKGLVMSVQRWRRNNEDALTELLGGCHVLIEFLNELTEDEPSNSGEDSALPRQMPQQNQQQRQAGQSAEHLPGRHDTDSPAHGVHMQRAVTEWALYRSRQHVNSLSIADLQEQHRMIIARSDFLHAEIEQLKVEQQKVLDRIHLLQQPAAAAQQDPSTPAKTRQRASRDQTPSSQQPAAAAPQDSSTPANTRKRASSNQALSSRPEKTASSRMDESDSVFTKK